MNQNSFYYIQTVIIQIQMKKVILFVYLLFCSGMFTDAQDINKSVRLDRYADANSALAAPSKSEKRVVFIGNSITEGWVNIRPAFFKSNNYVGRGISGQTSSQLLLRFRRDVINLQPVAVVINIGTNDIAQNTGVYNSDFTLDNIKSMAELAQANGIKVILSSVTPASGYRWNRDITEVPEKIMDLNSRIKAYAKAKGFAYIDYFSAMRDENNGLKSIYGDDGVHPNAEGYKVMEQRAKGVIDSFIRVSGSGNSTHKKHAGQ